MKQAAHSCKPVQIAVIGYGGMGSWHAAQLEEMPQFAVRGVYDIREERNALAREKGFYAYASLEELLADEQLELVTIATPNDLHRELAIAAMRAGKAVISEKPVALNSGELEEMIAVSNETGRLFTVHQNRLTRARWGAPSVWSQRCMARAVCRVIGATPRSTAAAWCWIGASTCLIRR